MSGWKTRALGLGSLLIFLIQTFAVPTKGQNAAHVNSQPQESALAAQLRALNNDVLQLHGQMQQGDPSIASSVRSQGAVVIAQRAAALTALMEKDPHAALSFAFSPELLADLVAKFPGSASQLESHATVSGTIEHWIADSADLQTFSESWRLNVGGQILNLYFGTQRPQNIAAGATVKITGVKLGSAIAVGSVVQSNASSVSALLPAVATAFAATGFTSAQRRPMLFLLLCGVVLTLALAAHIGNVRDHLRPYAVLGIALILLVSTPGTAFAQASSCTTTGVQKTLVLLAALPGITPPATAQQVSDIFFGTATGHALDGFWKEASYGQTSAVGGVFGWYTLTGSYSSCTVGAAFNEAMTDAAAAGVNFQNYSRIFFVFPQSIGCGWAGVTSNCSTLSTPSGSVTASLSYIVDTYMANRDQGVELVAHEGGHQLGLNHAGTINDEPTAVLGPTTGPGAVTEFNDFFNTMGAWTLGTYSASQKSEILNWMSSGTNYQPVQGSGTYTLQPLEANPPGLQALKVQRGSGNPGDYFWIEYRQPMGNYDSTIGFMNFAGALIHYEDPTTGTYTHVLDFTPSDVGRWYDTVLAPGQSWTDPYSNTSISVLGATASGLTVSVTYGAASCTSSAPGVTFSQLDPSIYPGQTASYTVSVSNNDSAGCSASTISLGSSEPSGWSTTLSSSSLTLSPGQSGSVNMSKGAPSGTPAGTYAVNLSAANSSSNGMGTANATVVTPPSLAVTASISGASFIPPSTVPITASVTNGGVPASGLSVTFTLKAPNGSTTTQNATTGTNGAATWSYKLNSKSPVGTYLVSAQAALSSGSKRTAASTQSATSATVAFSVQ